MSIKFCCQYWKNTKVVTIWRIYTGFIICITFISHKFLKCVISFSSFLLLLNILSMHACTRHIIEYIEEDTWAFYYTMKDHKLMLSYAFMDDTRMMTKTDFLLDVYCMVCCWHVYCIRFHIILHQSIRLL